VLKAGDTMLGPLTLASRLLGTFGGALPGRTYLQNTIANDVTAVGAIPNGTNTTALLQAFNSSDPANAANIQLRANNVNVTINSTFSGTGTLVPLSFQMNNVEKGRLNVDGSWTFLTPVSAQSFAASGVVMQGNTSGLGASEYMLDFGPNAWFSFNRTLDRFWIGNTAGLRVDGPLQSTRLSVGFPPGSPFGTEPLDVATAVGRIMFRTSGGANSIDSVNSANSAFAQLNFTAANYFFGGGNVGFASNVQALGSELQVGTASAITGGIADLQGDGNPNIGIFPAGAGTIRLRPNGRGSAVGQLTLSGATMNYAGRLEVNRDNPAPNANSFNQANITVTTNDGSFPMIGFHRGGVSGVALYHGAGGSGLRVINNAGADHAMLSELNGVTINTNQTVTGRKIFESQTTDGSGDLRVTRAGTSNTGAILYGTDNSVFSFRVADVGGDFYNITAPAGLVVSGLVRPSEDNIRSCGSPANRWTVVYAATGAINTSDAREKTTLTALSYNEIQAAKEIAKSIGVYKWLDMVAKKGDGARKHIGVTAQEVIRIMWSYNLDAMKYGLVCYDKWEESEITEPFSGEDMVLRTKKIKAGDRYGIRYDELMMFIAAGFEARLSALEAAL
jgi:hypothetical protein